MRVLRLCQWRKEIKWTKYIIVCQYKSNCQPIILLLWQIALCPITYAVKALVANMSVAKVFMAKLLNMKNLKPCIVAGFLASQSRPWKQVKPQIGGFSMTSDVFMIFFNFYLPLLFTFKYIIHLSSLANIAD